MNPVNATSLYVSASRSVLQCDPRDPRSLAELCKLLPFFRQSLSCLVCGNLLQDPIAPTDSSCQHYVCRGCKGQRMQLKPSCSWCKDYSRFQENQQLSLLVRCYRRLCVYIAQSPLAPHIAGAADDSPDLQAVLSEGVALAEGEPDAEDAPPDPPPPGKEAEGAKPAVGAVNGLQSCNGLLDSAPPPPGGGVAKQETAVEAALCDITAFSDDLKHHATATPTGGALLLSVEEVLRTLEPDPTPPSSIHQPSLNGPSPSLPTQSRPCPPLPHPSAVAEPLVPPRCHRKRSRSESDSEKLQPLPIASLLRGAPLPLAASRSPHHPNLAPAKQEPPKFLVAAPLPHLATVPNGGPPKVGKTVLVPSKPLKKTLEHHSGPRKAYAKARQGTPKPRASARDRPQPLPLAPPPPPLTLPPPPHPHTHPLTHPPSPSKPLYKKPVEKKGCKCGRATQNPSVLTCRGQRCPCYSNRKACLDCICRGCQNSYMANGEKKLEAFAVPEKALEQTRLTLGINLTSIAAAALRSPAASSPGGGSGGGAALLNVSTATGAPVTATFLSGAGHDSRGFDDSLEMRFDC